MIFYLFHLSAVSVYRSLESQHLKNNVSLLCSLGQSHYRSGDRMSAITCYEKVRILEKLCLEGMDIFALILAEENRKVGVCVWVWVCVWVYLCMCGCS